MSVAVTAAMLTAGTALAQPTVTVAGQVMDGACASTTVTVNEHVGPVDEVTFTVVVPLGKKDPDAGE